MDVMIEACGKVVRVTVDHGSVKEIVYGKLLGEVVRCKDCSFYMMRNDGIHGDCVGMADGRATDPDDYCSWAERKEE